MASTKNGTKRARHGKVKGAPASPKVRDGKVARADAKEMLVTMKRRGGVFVGMRTFAGTLRPGLSGVGIGWRNETASDVLLDLAGHFDDLHDVRGRDIADALRAVHAQVGKLVAPDTRRRARFSEAHAFRQFLLHAMGAKAAGEARIAIVAKMAVAVLTEGRATLTGPDGSILQENDLRALRSLLPSSVLREPLAGETQNKLHVRIGRLMKRKPPSVGADNSDMATELAKAILYVLGAPRKKVDNLFGAQARKPRS